MVLLFLIVLVGGAFAIAELASGAASVRPGQPHGFLPNTLRQ